MAFSRSALVVEDEFVVVLDLEQVLSDLKISMVADHSSGATALAWLTENSPDIAIIDYRLRDGISADLAKALAERNIPTIVYSGYEQDIIDHNDAYVRAKWLSKPADYPKLASAIGELLSSVASDDETSAGK